MNLDLYEQSFSTAQIAATLGITPQAVNKRAASHDWEEEPIKIQGGGRLWRFKSMDVQTKKRLSIAAIRDHQKAEQQSGVATADEKVYAQKWDEFDKKPNSIKNRAFDRYLLMVDVIQLRDSGTTLSDAFAAVSAKHNVSIGTMRNWYFGTGGKEGIKNIPQKHWIPYLADNYKGRVKKAECTPKAWEWFKTDYLRLERPSLQSSYRRLSSIALIHDWIIPSARTLGRWLIEQFTWNVIHYRRTKELVNDYPDQVRQRDTFKVGQAVSGDALTFDRIFVLDDETGEIFNPRVWFFEDVYSGRILSWEADRSENSDMFRRSLYNLTATVLPQFIYIDNTRAAANKCLTGQAQGRRRFTNKATDPVGLIKLFGITPCFTNPDHEVASPGSKPIERAFGIGNLHSSFVEWPSLIGRGNSVSNPIPYAEFLKLLPKVVAEHNARKGRTGGICNGRSFDEVFAEGLKDTTLRTASDDLRRILLCSQEVAKVSKQCFVTLKAGRGTGKHRYYAEGLGKYIGEYVAVLFDPKNMSGDVTIYDLNGKRICTATWQPTVAFNDTKAARAHNIHKTRRAKLIKKAAAEATKMDILEYQQLNMGQSVPSPMPPAKTTTVLSQQEVDTKVTSTISKERAEELRKNLSKRLGVDTSLHGLKYGIA